MGTKDGKERKGKTTEVRRTETEEGKRGKGKIFKLIRQGKESISCRKETTWKVEIIFNTPPISMSCFSGSSAIQKQLCFSCAADITGKTPFEYEDNKFCSVGCVKKHRMKK